MVKKDINFKGISYKMTKEGDRTFYELVSIDTYTTDSTKPVKSVRKT